MMMEVRVRAQSDRSQSIASSPGDINVQQSFSHRSFTDIGMKLKACNDTLGELQQLGIQHVAQLPELVMVGDQSAGKSSLMSGLAELNLPRSGGVCTRCPIHIRLSRNKDPVGSCTVSLQLDYDYKPTGRIKRADVTKANPFPPWVEKPHREIKSFKTIYNKEEIEEVLRWAQVAILNSNRNSDLFIPGEGAEAKETHLADAVRNTEAQFSPNIVALEVKGPNLPDLSFYDLPGVFLSPPQEEDEYIVQVVRNLTSHYVRRPQAIIMWALPMNQDPENSISLGIIREAKAGRRTIGVMTKADMVQTDNTAPWVSMLRGEKHPVGQGYFITSRPSDEALESATQWEKRFFHDGPSNWPVEFREFQDRCGVELLTEFISRRLGDAFADSLPSIKQKVNARLRDVRIKLSELPELPNNVEHEVKTSLYKFCGDVKDAIRDPSFMSEWDTLNKQFQECLIKMKPTCIVKDDDPPPVIDLGGSDGETSPVDTPSRKRPRPSDSTMRTTGTPRRIRTDGSFTQQMAPPVKNELDAAVRASTPVSVSTTPMPCEPPSPFVQFYQLGRQGLSIKDIRAEIMRRKLPGMPPNVIPQETYTPLFKAAIRKWEKPLQLYLQRTMAIFQRVIHSALDTSMSTFMQRNIYVQSQTHLNDFVATQDAMLDAKLVDLFLSELDHMFVIDGESYKRYKELEEETLRRARNISRLKAAGFLWEPVDRAKEQEHLRKNLPRLGEDSYAAEIEVASVVRGYYIMAAMHFARSVVISVNSNLLRPIAERQLDQFLDTKLGLSSGSELPLLSSDPTFSHPLHASIPSPVDTFLCTANDASDVFTYQHLMEEDDAIAQQRNQLKREMRKPRKATDSINELEAGGGGRGIPLGVYDGDAGATDEVMDMDSVMEDEDEV